MIQFHDRTRTSTASLSTKNSQNKTMHQRGRSAALNFRNHFGGHSVIFAVIRDKSALYALPKTPIKNQLII